MISSNGERPVLTQRMGKAGIITLNRPEALHALNTPMCELIRNALDRWRNDPNVELVIIEAASQTKGFCAGGDVRMLAESGRNDCVEAKRFFNREYQLNALIKSYPKPYIALLDGITMGGGVGISVHGSHRVVTERTVFAMPETGIGLFPDVGGTWFLPRLEGQLGMWLGLTGARLKGRDVLGAGIGTHFINSQEIVGLKDALAKNGMTAMEELSQSARLSFHNHLEELNRCFTLKSVRGIITQLKTGSEWARQQAQTIETKSPLSLRIAHQQIRLGTYLTSFRSAMMLEYRVATRLVSSHDFQEGVRAVLIDKDHLPSWRPNRLFAISDDLVSSYFRPLGDDELKFEQLEHS